MQKSISQNSLANRDKQPFLLFDLPELELHLKTVQLESREYQAIIMRLIGEQKVIKKQLEGAAQQQQGMQQHTDFSLIKKLEEAEKKILELKKIQQPQEANKQIESLNNKQLIDFARNLQELQLIKNSENERIKIDQQTLLQLNENQKDIFEQNNKLLNAQKDKIEEFVLKFIQPISGKIFSEGIEKSELFKNLESMWDEISKCSQEVQERLKNFIKTRSTEQNNSDFLQCQRNQQIQSNAANLDSLKRDFLQIQALAGNFLLRVEREKQHKDQNTQNILSQVSQFVSYNQQIIQRTLDLIDGLVQEQKRLHQLTEELIQKNIILSQSIQKITQDHFKKIADLRIKFNEERDKLFSQTTYQQLQNQYNKNQIQELSELSLKIHKKFYEKIQNDLSNLSISFVNIAIRNILGSYLSSKESNDSILQNKQLAIQETERFTRSTQNGENNEISKFIDNSKRLLNVFENFFSQSRKDSKSKCFTISFINSQKAINQLQIYLESIQQGVQEFIEEHQKLKNLESQYQR